MIPLFLQLKSDSEDKTDFERKIAHEFIQGSAIDVQLFKVSIEIIQDAGRWEPNFALNQRVSTQWQTRKPHSYGSIAALNNEDGSLWQAKAENPRFDAKKQKPQRYETPVGNGSRAFLPAVTVEIWVEIARRNQLFNKLPDWVRRAYDHGNLTLKSGSNGLVAHSKDSSFWDWIEQFPELSIVLTEGGKKSLCLLSQGTVAISLYGVHGGYLSNDIIGGEKVRKLKPELIPDLQRFAVPGRSITLAFDQDESFKTRREVCGAIAQFGRLLTESGCEVQIATWHGRDGKGIDDLIVNCGIEAWENSLSEAVSYAQWTIAYRLAHEVRRKADLNIGDREFIEVISALPKTGILTLYGGKGSGKSKAIGEMIKLFTWLSITHLTSLGRDQAKGWGGVFVNDGDWHGSKLLKNGVPVNGGSVCVPSLMKVSAVKADVLVLDEVSANLEFILGSKLANKEGMRPLLLSEYVQRIRSAQLVILADADLSEEALEFIEFIRGERSYLVQSERKALTYDATVIDGSKHCAIALLQSRIEESKNDKLFYLNADSKALAEALTELLGRNQTLLITGDTSGGEIEASFLASKGHDLPGLLAQGIRFIVSSPSVVQGFSIEHHTDLIDSVWGFYSGCSISAHSIAQAPNRVRDSDVPRFFWVAKKGSAYSRLNRSQSIPVFLKEFKQLNTTAARLVSSSLTPETQIEVERIDWQSQNLRMLAAIEVRRNRGMAALRETLIALLRKEGKKVSIIKPHFSKDEIALVSAMVSEASEMVTQRHCEAVAGAKMPTQEEVNILSEQTDPLTPEQVLSLEKFYLAEFYRLEAVRAEDVKFDRQGRTKTEIKALEAVITPDLAIATTARTLNQNAQTPQDWKPEVVKVWLLEHSGAAVLMHDIAAGTIQTLPVERVQLIAEFVRSHSTEFRMAFHFSNVEQLSDQQIVGEILRRHGIRTKRCGNRNHRRYVVCKEELAAVLAILERRQSVPPLQELEVNRGGGIGEAVDARVAASISEMEVSEEDLADIRELYASIESLEEKEMVKSCYAIEVWKQAMGA